MASKLRSDAENAGNQGKEDLLPFEPSSNRKKGNSRAKVVEPTSTASSKGKPSTKANNRIATTQSKAIADTKSISKQRRSQDSRQDTAIPEAVSRRMIKRMAVLCGIPTALGLSTFIVSYFIVINGVIDVPPIAVLLVSLGFFGLGVIGISYGALSTSWDVDNEGGSVLGWNEFTTNLGRMKQAWQEARNQTRS